MTKLVECKNCKGMVAQHAKICPACGAEDPASGSGKQFFENAMTPSTVANLIVGGFFAAVIFGLYSCMNDSPEEKAQKNAAAAEKKKAGFHCLSAWDGSHARVVRDVKAQLRDPNSFEHVNTKITPADSLGNHVLYMSYRAKNGFGGMTNGLATASVHNATCDAQIITHQ